MPYSAFVIVALIIHVLINIDFFIKNDAVMSKKSYRLFLISIAIFYLTDILWGVFESSKLSLALYIDTFIYFIMMGATIFFWTIFVVGYLEGNIYFSKSLKGIGLLFFMAEVAILIANFFASILFTVDENAVYEAYIARHVMLYAQIVMYALVTIYSIIHTLKSKEKNYRRYIAVSAFSIVMATCIAIQIGDPYIPLYSIGCLIGICLLNTFAINDTKERFKSELDETVKITEKTKEELGNAIHLVYNDSLTDVKSKHAYVEMEEQFDRLIAQKSAPNFAVVVFDINGLKEINDNLGHKSGDDYIVESVKVITSHFPKDTIYRFGGDEFVAVLEDEAFINRKSSFEEFEKHIDENLKTNGPIISSGMSRFRIENDNTFKAVFNRADKMMYARKMILKEHKNA